MHHVNNLRSGVPKSVDLVFRKTSPKRSFSVIKIERFGLVFAKTGSINSGTGIDSQPAGWQEYKIFLLLIARKKDRASLIIRRRDWRFVYGWLRGCSMKNTRLAFWLVLNLSSNSIFNTELILKGTVAWDRFRQDCQNLTDVGIEEGRAASKSPH